jgi:APA family basic amino acid/polyamine antiporter
MPLKPVLGPIQLIFYSVGVIVGAGVYSVIGSAAGLAQGSLWLSFLVGAGVAMLTAFSYAEMATSFPVAGAEYAYIRKAWPRADWLAFTVGLVILLGGAATAATVAMAFGGYLRVFIDIPATAAALVLLALCSALNIWGLRESSWLNIAFTSIEVLGLLLVIAAGFMSEASPSPAPSGAEPAVMAAAALLFFVYLGFEEVANLAEEVRHPARDIPLALFVSMGITTALYVMVAVAVIAISGPAQLAASEAPLATAIENVWPRARNLLSAIALFATANTVLITLIATSRLAFSMGRDGEIAGIFGSVLRGRQTPWVAAILSLTMATILLPAGSVKVLAEISSFAALLAFVSVNVVLIVLRYKMPDYPRPFQVPLAIGRFPILPLMAIISILALLVHFDWQIYAAGGMALALSALAFLARRVFRRRRS